MNNLREKFDEYGFVTSKNLLSNAEKKKIISVIYQEFSNLFKLKNRKKFSIQDQSFHDNLKNLRKKNPKKFGEIYDKFKLNAYLRSIFYSSKFLKLFSKILNTKEELIYINGFMLRFDAPNDKRNSLNWHQDTPYYLMTYPENNAGVCWLAITNNSKENGSLAYIPKSHYHLEKFVSSKKNKSTSEQRKIKIYKNELKKTKYLKQNFGSASFLHLNLKHRSGKNITKKFRITLACRFHDTKQNFNIGTEVYKYNKRVKFKI